MTERFWKDRLAKIPRLPGVYLMRDAVDTIIYIGKAKSLRSRLSSYFRSDAGDKAAAIVNAIRRIDYILSASEAEALIVERQLINSFQPYFNVQWRDGKTFPYIELTVREDFPRLLLTRHRVENGSEYFGPYPRVFHIKHLLRWMQKVFKWRPCRLSFSATSLPKPQKVRSCLYRHTGRCPAPCLGMIAPDDYRKSIIAARLFLKGRFGALESKWERDMRAASASMDYETAADLRDRLAALRSLTEKVVVREIAPEELARTLRVTTTLEELRDALGLPRIPSIIETFDISNISGTDAVGSMVRFHNGRPDRTAYRRFKIKTVRGSDDFAMMREVVGRRYARLSREGSPLPDLVLIDGGKGQLAAAETALRDAGAAVPLASLAKRDEEVFVPGEQERIRLGKDSPALLLLMAARDEAHRFALSYHHVRRSHSSGISARKGLHYGH